MSATFRSSGDLSADRRYLWGEGAREAGDATGAADLFRQAVDIAPHWAPGWFAYGRAAFGAGDSDTARAALTRCLELEPGDALGAALLLGRIDGRVPAMPPAYVAGLFDAYADRFDAHLTGALGYCGPQVLRRALEQSCNGLGRPARFAATLDLGCGTGLMAAALADMAGPIDGVDLSTRMLAKARGTGHYRSLSEADALAALLTAPDAYDLIVAADVLVYLGDLAPLFAAAASRLTGRGLFAFTAQRGGGAGYSFGTDMRYAHAPAYLERTAAAAGLRTNLCESVSTRRDAGLDVPGLVLVLSLQDATGREGS